MALNNIMKNYKTYRLLFASLAVILISSTVNAETGSEIFRTAACNLLDNVLTKDFGALMTVLAGVFAIFSAIVGSFRNAWILVFVSVGIYIYPTIVARFFPHLGCSSST